MNRVQFPPRASKESKSITRSGRSTHRCRRGRPAAGVLGHFDPRPAGAVAGWKRPNRSWIWLRTWPATRRSRKSVVGTPPGMPDSSRRGTASSGCRVLPPAPAQRTIRNSMRFNRQEQAIAERLGVGPGSPEEPTPRSRIGRSCSTRCVRVPRSRCVCRPMGCACANAALSACAGKPLCVAVACGLGRRRLGSIALPHAARPNLAIAPWAAALLLGMLAWLWLEPSAWDWPWCSDRSRPARAAVAREPSPIGRRRWRREIEPADISSPARYRGDAELK